MRSKFEVRFASHIVAGVPSVDTEPPRTGRRKGKSHQGCRQCKQRRVKCDERYPICIRCERQRLVCEAMPRAQQWQMEMPMSAIHSDSSPLSNRVKPRLLRYWMEKASGIMVLDPADNPLSFPIAQHLRRSPALLHALQSISAAHEQFFQPGKLLVCLEQRHESLRLVQHELGILPPSAAFLTVFLLGLSTAWTDAEDIDIGETHLLGARALVNDMIQQRQPGAELDAEQVFVLGAYLFWDMASSFLVDPQCHATLDGLLIWDTMTDISEHFHPIGGHCMYLYNLLARVGRYCRRVAANGSRDEALEAELERGLLTYTVVGEDGMLTLLADTFRIHGLINLYRSRKNAHNADTMNAEQVATDGIQHVKLQQDVQDEAYSCITMSDTMEVSPSVDSEVISDLDAWIAEALKAELSSCGETWLENETESSTAIPLCKSPNTYEEASKADQYKYRLGEDQEVHIHRLALACVRKLRQIPTANPITNLQPIPLFTAGTELLADDADEREWIVEQFQSLHSINRLPANLKAVKFLQHYWNLKDHGSRQSWLDVMLPTGVRLFLG